MSISFLRGHSPIQVRAKQRTSSALIGHAKWPESKGARSRPVIKVGNLDIQRDFCDVRDIVKAYILLLKKGRRGEPYNICSGKTIALREILEVLLKEAAVSHAISIDVDPAKLRKIDMPVQMGSNQKIVEETGWSPEIPIERTLRDLLIYWRRKLGKEKT